MTFTDGETHHFDHLGKILIKHPKNLRDTTYEWDEERLMKITLPEGDEFEFTYDNRGYLQSVEDPIRRITSFEINENGDLIQIQNPDSTAKEFEYNAEHALVLERSESGKETGYQLTKGRLIREYLPGNRIRNIRPSDLEGVIIPEPDGKEFETEPVSIDATEGSASSFSGDCTEYMLPSKFGGSGRMRDCIGRVTERSVLYGGQLGFYKREGGKQAFYSHDMKGRLHGSTVNKVRTRIEFDTDEDYPNRFQDDFNRTVHLAYNSRGLLTGIQDQLGMNSTFTYDSNANLVMTKDQLENETTFEYDTNQNVAAVNDPNGNRIELERDGAGNIVQMKDPLNRVSSFEYDSFNRLTSAQDGMGFVTNLFYSHDGLLEKLTNAKNQSTLFGYGQWNRKVSSMTNPLGQTESYFYDGNERLIKKTQLDGSDVDFAYDLAGQLLSRTATNVAESYQYNANGDIASATSNGRAWSFGYETDTDRLDQAGAFGFVVGYDYDLRGLRVRTISEGLGVTVNYDYDERKQLRSMSANLGGQVLNWSRTYDEIGRPEIDTLPNGMQVSYSYDAGSRLTSLKNLYSNGEALSQFDYSYNVTGTISQIQRTFKRPLQNTIGSIVTNYGYDNSDRLTSAKGEGSFVYDQLGNMTHFGGQFNQLNQLLEDDHFVYSYDLNANQASKVSKQDGKVITYTWDGLSRKTSEIHTKGSTTLLAMSFGYDPLGRRYKKTVNGVVTYFLYDGEDILAELNEDLLPKALYLHGPGIDDPIAIVRDVDEDGNFESQEVFIYTKDHLGSIREMSDLQQNPIQRYNYTSYGRTTLEKMNATSEKFILNPYGFTGREWDEGGDYYYRARYYDPFTGRFLSLDPIGFAGGDESLYRYVRNTPISYSDPYGEKKYTVVVVGAIAVGGAYLVMRYVYPEVFRGVELFPEANANEIDPKKDQAPPVANPSSHPSNMSNSSIAMPGNSLNSDLSNLLSKTYIHIPNDGGSNRKSVFNYPQTNIPTIQDLIAPLPTSSRSCQ